MSRIATKIGNVSAHEMYQIFVDQLLIDNPSFTTKSWKNISRGEVRNGDKVYINYDKYKKILSAYNKKAGHYLIHGWTLDLMNGLGNLFAIRAERSHSNKKLNMAKSMALRAQLKAEGVELTKDNWHVPYTDDDYCAIIWHKGNGLLRHIKLYHFHTAGGQPGKGFRQIFSNSLKGDPLLKAKYPFIPVKRLEFIEYKKEEQNGL